MNLFIELAGMVAGMLSEYMQKNKWTWWRMLLVAGARCFLIFFVYGVRSSLGERLTRFFLHDWPQAVRSLWIDTLISLALLLAGVLVGYALVAQDPAWYNAFVSQDMAGGRDPIASTERLRETLYDGGSDYLGVFATFLFTHNAQIAILAFALGFAFGVPTALLLIYNGSVVGAFLALFVSRGLGMELGGWLLIHGTTELFAIVLAGGSGLRIGWCFAFPGIRSRLTAAAAAGKKAAIVMAGVVLMLLIAGLLEGFSRQLVTNDAIRYTVAGSMLLLWMSYFYLLREPSHG